MNTLRWRALWIAFGMAVGLAIWAPALLGQARVGSWPTELAAGAALDLAARGPWIAPAWRGSFRGRVVLAASASVFYECAVEPWNGHGNACRASDLGQRLVGTLGMEALWWLGRRVL